MKIENKTQPLSYEALLKEATCGYTIKVLNRLLKEGKIKKEKQ